MQWGKHLIQSINNRYRSCYIRYHCFGDSGDHARSDDHSGYTDAGAGAAEQSACRPGDADNSNHVEVEHVPLEIDLDHVRPDASDRFDHGRQHVADQSDHAAPDGC